MGQSGELIIDAGSSETRPLLLSEWIAFDNPGIYTIRIGVENMQSEATLKVVVGPRDTVRLRQICDDLARQVAEHQSMWPAQVLSFIADPEAVPYLAKFEEEQLESLAVPALARIGNRDAALVIASIMERSHDEALIVVARSGLRAIRARTTEQGLKREIDLMLMARLDLDYKWGMCVTTQPCSAAAR